MQKKLPILILILFIAGFWLWPQGAVSQDYAVPFETGSWAELFQKAKKEKKPVVVDFYATWCGPCKAMDKTTFQDQALGSFVKGNYLAYKVDVDKGEGQRLANDYKITSVPTFIIFDPNEKVVHRWAGYKDAKGFQALLEQHLPAAGTGSILKLDRNSRQELEQQYFAGKAELLQQQLATVLKAHPNYAAQIQQAKAFGSKNGELLFEMHLAELPADKRPDSQETAWLMLDYLVAARDYDNLTKRLNQDGLWKTLPDALLHRFVWSYTEAKTVPPDVMRWVNELLRAAPSAHWYDTKAAFRYREGLLPDAEQAIKLSQKAAGFTPELKTNQDKLSQLVMVK